MKVKRTSAKFAPNEEQRNVVSMLAAVLTPLDHIAAVVINPETKKGIALNTLKAAFPEEIALGRIKVKAFAVGKLFKLMQDGVPSAIYFYLKTQCGWRETEVREHTGKDGGPIPIALSGSVSLYIPDNGRARKPRGNGKGNGK